MNNLFEGKIGSLNNLPYAIDNNNNSWIKEKDIISYLCKGNVTFYMKYFMGKTYLNIKNNNGNFPLLNTLIAAHEVFEIIADMENKSEDEIEYEKKVFPFIVQLAKIGINETLGERTPLEVMEEMLINNE